jgi:hypothetical protein
MKLVGMVICIAVAGLILASIAHNWILPGTPLWLFSFAGIVVAAAILTAFAIWNWAYVDYQPVYAVAIGGIIAYVIYGALIDDLYIYVPPSRGAPQGAAGSHFHLLGLEAWSWVVATVLTSLGLLVAKADSDFLNLGDTTRKVLGFLFFLGSPVILWVMYLWTH